MVNHNVVTAKVVDNSILLQIRCSNTIGELVAAGRVPVTNGHRIAATRTASGGMVAWHITYRMPMPDCLPHQTTVISTAVAKGNGYGHAMLRDMQTAMVHAVAYALQQHMTKADIREGV